MEVEKQAASDKKRAFISGIPMLSGFLRKTMSYL